MTAQITHLPADAPQEELLHCMAEDGAVIIDDVLGDERLEALGNDLAPFLNKEVYGRDAFTGFRTQRIASRALLVEPRSRALTSNEMSLICERKITFVSHSFASRSRILRRDALRPNVRALNHRASDPNTPSVRSPSRRRASSA